MGHIKTATLSRHTAPPFVLVAGLELMQLRKLGWLARCLFLELLAMADHTTGRVSTSYAVLASLLDFDAAPQAHSAATPTQQRIRTALADLVALRLVKVDRIANEKRQGLFLQVQSRVGIGSPANMINRVSNRVARPKKPDATKTYTAPARDDQQTEQQGVQDENPSPISPLSTGTEAASARAKLKVISAGIARRAPPGQSPRGG